MLKRIVQGLTPMFFLSMIGCNLDQRYIYFPTPWEQADWSRLSGLPIQDVRFQAEDGVNLHGWWIEAPESAAVLLWCHGNAGNIIDRLDNIAALYRRRLSVFIFDYRGYGQSEGKPSEPGLYKDALAAYDTLTLRLGAKPERIVIFGRSLGAAVAAELAVRRKAAGLILETPLHSIKAVAQAHYGLLPVHVLLRDRYDLTSRFKDIAIPVLVIHAENDTIVPLELGRKVYEAAREPKDFYLIKGAGHNDTYIVGGEPYFDRLITFMREVTS